MIDATMVGRTRSKTRIEGMDQLNKSADLEAEYANMTDAERQMREEELSFYSASDNDHGDDNIWGLLSGVGGNIYEWYVGVGLQDLVVFHWTYSSHSLFYCSVGMILPSMDYWHPKSVLFSFRKLQKSSSLSIPLVYILQHL